MAGYMNDAKTDLWATPKHLLESIVEEFGVIDLDPCATPTNTVSERFYTVEDDGLKKCWDARFVYVNPPYGRGLIHWTTKAVQSIENDDAQLIVMLLPSRTETRWFWVLLESELCEIRFIKGRLKYGDGKKDAPFGSCLAILCKR